MKAESNGVANTVKFYGCVNSFAQFHPQDYGDRYFTEMPLFNDWLHARNWRSDLCGLGDGLLIFPDKNERRTFMDRLGTTFAQNGDFAVPANEANHGDQISQDEAMDLGRMWQGRGFTVAMMLWDGAGIPVGTETMECLDVVYGHSERGKEWCRKAGAVREWRDGFPWNDAAPGKSFHGFHVPCEIDESTGAAAQMRGDSRSNVPEDFAWDGATMGLMGSGGAFMSDSSFRNELMNDVEVKCCRQFFAALSYIPIGCQFANYKRGGANDQNVGDMPWVHHDEGENAQPQALRSYSKEDPETGDDFGEAIRTTGEFVLHGGWTLVEEPQLGIGRFTRV